MPARRSTHQVTGDRDQVVEGLGLEHLVETLVVLLAGQPALRVRGAQHGGHLFAVGVGGPEVAAGDGPDVGGFGKAVAHPPRYAAGVPVGEVGRIDSGPVSGGFGGLP